MANHKSAIKRIRQNERRNEINRGNAAPVRTEIKKLQKALDENRVDDAKAMLPATLGAISRSAQKGVMHQNKADRTKSRLNAQVQKAAAS